VSEEDRTLIEKKTTGKEGGVDLTSPSCVKGRTVAEVFEPCGGVGKLDVKKTLARSEGSSSQRNSGPSRGTRARRREKANRRDPPFLGQGRYRESRGRSQLGEEGIEGSAQKKFRTLFFTGTINETIGCGRALLGAD